MKLFKYFFFLSFALVAMYSCKPEFPSWETDTVFPLFDTRLQISDFAGDTLITVGDDNLLSLYYEYSLSDFNFDSLLTDMDTIASYTYVSPFTITLAPGAQVLNKAEVSKLGLKDVYLKVLTISNGTINIRTSNKYLQPIRIEYSIPEATMNGSAFTITRDIPAAASAAQPYQYEENIQVENLRWLFFSTGSGSYNCYNSTFKVWISPNATEQVMVNHNDPFTFYIGFDNIDIAYARGYFGQYEQEFSDETDIDLFRQITADGFSLDSVGLFLEVTNYLGMDMRLRLAQLKGLNIHNNQEVSYSGTYLNTPINIIRAPETGVEQGLGPVETFVFDLSSGSNLKDFVENLPGKLFIKLLFETNPLGNVSGGNDHYYGLPADAKLIFTMPLHFSAQNLVLADTTSFSSDFLSKPIQELSIRAKIFNCFPLSFNLTMNFLDSNYTHLCSLPFDMPVQSALMLSNGRTAGPKLSNVHLNIPQSLLNPIREARHISFIFSVSTMPYGENVKIFSDYYIDISTFAHLRLLINNEE